MNDGGFCRKGYCCVWIVLFIGYIEMFEFVMLNINLFFGVFLVSGMEFFFWNVIFVFVFGVEILFDFLFNR